MKSLILTYLLVSFSLFCQSQNTSVTAKNASCHEVCDGSATFSGLDIDSDNEYLWRNMESERFSALSSNRISNLCTGRYELRTKKWEALTHHNCGEKSELKEGYVHLKSMRLNTHGVRDVQIDFQFAQEFDNPSFYVSTFFSLDKGDTWRETSQIFQEANDQTGETRYVINLPKVANNRADVLVNIQQRTPKRKSGVPILNLLGVSTKGRMVESLKFDVGVEEYMKISSVVSNVIEGSDGYINLDVSGGIPPYRYVWKEGESVRQLNNLSAGSYEVTVTDIAGCSETASYKVLQVGYTTSQGQFTLAQDSGSNFVLSIIDLYRQPLKLTLQKDGTEVKTYRINPLHEDLKMVLDLSYLESGQYIAFLTGSDFSERVDIQIR